MKQNVTAYSPKNIDTFDKKIIVYFKFKGNNIFTGTEMLNSNSVLIVNKNKTIEAIVDINDAGDGVQVVDGIICPGFINCHCHLELSFLKNAIPQKTGMVNFILQILNKRQANIEFIEECIANAENEMIENGIVAVGDICNTTHTIKQKQKNNLFYKNFIEIAGFIPNTAKQRFNDGITIYNEFKKHFGNHVSLVPHASYSVSKELFCLINECSANKIISIHNQESEDENLFIKHKQGDFLRLYKQLGIDISFFNSTQKSSLQYYINSLQNAAKTILVHNTFTQKEDVALINILSKTNKTQFFLCLCVITNEYINNCFPNFKVLFSNNQNIVIGTDSLASNHSLNILTEIQTIHHLYNEIGINELLQFATFNGATALGIENEFGSFKKDTKPGVLLIENFMHSKKPITLV